MSDSIEKNNEKPIEGELVEKDLGGRPTKLDASMIPKLYEMMDQGRSNAQICAELNISERTFYRWKKENEDFREWFEIGQMKRLAYWESLGEAGMLGKIPKFNATIYLANMNSRFNGWAREQKDEKATQTINIENMQVLQGIQQLDDKELDSKIQAALSKYEGIVDDNEGSEEA